MKEVLNVMYLNLTKGRDGQKRPGPPRSSSGRSRTGSMGPSYSYPLEH
jgi:hypothetical protein